MPHSFDVVVRIRRSERVPEECGWCPVELRRLDLGRLGGLDAALELRHPTLPRQLVEKDAGQQSPAAEYTVASRLVTVVLPYNSTSTGKGPSHGSHHVRLHPRGLGRPHHRLQHVCPSLRLLRPHLHR